MQNASIEGAKGRQLRGTSWTMIQNEDDAGNNPYAGSHEDVSNDLVSRKRDIVKERKISPKRFCGVHRTTTRQDDKAMAQSLNQMNAKQLAMMMLKKQSA